MALESLEDALNMREEAEKVIITKTKELVLEALNPASWEKGKVKEGGESYYKCIFGTISNEFMITDYGLLKYLKNNCSKQFDQGDVDTAISQLRKEGRIHYTTTSYWQYHQDNDVEGYALGK